MDLHKFYEEILDIVCKETGTDKADIFKSNKEPNVDARYLLVSLISGYFSDIEISKLTGLSRSCANKIRNAFYSKMKKYSFKQIYSILKDKITFIEKSTWGG